MGARSRLLAKLKAGEDIPGTGITLRRAPEQLELERRRPLSYYRRVLYFCGKCGQCRYVYQDAYWSRVCPSGELRKFEAYYLGGKNLLLWGLLSGKLEWTSKAAEILYHCTLCGNCVQQCQLPEIHNYALEWVHAARVEVVKRGLGPMPEHRRFGEWVRREHNPYMEPHSARLSWLGEKPKGKGEVAYFVGCTCSYRELEVAKAVVSLLKSSGVKFTLLEDEWCCGSPLYWTGQVDVVEELARHNARELEKTEAAVAVTSCAGCYRMLKQIYPEVYGVELSMEVLHISELLLKLVKEGALQPERELSWAVTYHDPCHLGRHTGVYEAPRQLIGSIRGLELREMLRNRRNAWCCGAGAGVKSAFKQLASYAASERIREAEETGAQVLLTACPFCEMNLREAAEKAGSKIRVLDITQALSYSIKASRSEASQH